MEGTWLWTLKIWENNLCHSMGPNGGSVAMNSGLCECGSARPSPFHYIKTVRYLYSRAPTHCSGSDFRGLFLFRVTQKLHSRIHNSACTCILQGKGPLTTFLGPLHSPSQSCVQVYIALYSDKEYILPAKDHRLQSAI
jgi:hypothetical protein